MNKKKEARIKWFFPKECVLVIFVGTRDEAELKAEEVFGEMSDILAEPYGLTRKPEGSHTIFIWLNEPKIQNSDGMRTLGQTLLHELLHVKQYVEDLYFRPGEKWPTEFEAYYIQSMYEEACEKLNIRG